MHVNVYVLRLFDPVVGCCCVLWFVLQVLQCVSRLELAQLIGTGVKTRYLTHGGLQQSPKTVRTTSNVDSVLSGSGVCVCAHMCILTAACVHAADPKKMATIQEQVEETSSQSVVVAVDRIFTGSTRLDTTAIGDV